MKITKQLFFGVVFWIFFVGGPTAGFAQTTDTDHDGFPDEMEMIFGTDPHDASSRLSLADNHHMIKNYWPLIEDAVDHLGTGIDGELNGGAEFRAGALKLQGRDAYVDFGNSETLSASNALAWSVWVKPKSLGLARILGKFKTPADGREYACFLLGGRIWVFLSDDGTVNCGHSLLAVTRRPAICRGKWSHIAVSWKADELVKIYVNGVERDVISTGRRPLSFLANSNAPLTLGAYDVVERRVGRRQHTRIDIRNSFSGNMAGLIMFSDSLEDVEVREIWALGRGGDLLEYIARDYDADGLPDWWERLFFGDTSEDAESDTDGDGLTNVEELAQGLDPLVDDNPNGGTGGDRDTDGDGLPDSDEEALGMDPNEPYTLVSPEALGLKIFIPLR